MKKNKIRLTQVVILVISMVSFVSCIPTPTEPPIPIHPTEDYSSQVSELKQNQEKWESQHITHYQMSVNHEAGGQISMPIIVEVKDSIVVSVIDAQGENVSFNDDEWQNYQYLFSVPGLFSYISQMYSENPPSMAVTFDPTLGYPTFISIDPFTEPCCQDFSIYIQDFQVLSP